MSELNEKQKKFYAQIDRLQVAWNNVFRAHAKAKGKGYSDEMVNSSATTLLTDKFTDSHENVADVRVHYDDKTGKFNLEANYGKVETLQELAELLRAEGVEIGELYESYH